jgi:hypothetical protein
MQPYLFPYLGYYQLVNAVDKFIYYDDVAYIKNGWINRNYLKINNTRTLFTVPLNDPSSYKAINETYIHEQLYNRWKKKFFRMVNQNYGKAPYFEDIMDVISSVFLVRPTTISILSQRSVSSVSEYLGLNVGFELSSIEYGDTVDFERTDRLISICKSNNAAVYINLSGGTALYSVEDFERQNIGLKFLKVGLTEENRIQKIDRLQYSIIDVLMYNSIEQTREMLNNYTLV